MSGLRYVINGCELGWRRIDTNRFQPARGSDVIGPMLKACGGQGEEPWNMESMVVLVEHMREGELLWVDVEEPTT